MDIFLGSTANFVNNVHQAINTPVPPAQQPKPTQESRIDFGGANTTKKNNSSGSLDSLGGGNIL